ncbi:MAG TPA: porin [Alphaproteobacteria bacterium]|nr:porin [Alphaproteobacteria bacterium]
MRKLLLATTALVGGIVIATGTAHAQAMEGSNSAPITLNVGGYVDFAAGFYQESNGGNNAVAATAPGKTTRSGHDFETEYKLNFDAMGKANNGIEYGANVSLWNGAEATTATPFSGGSNGVTVNSAYVWMAGDFGKVLMGDVHGATDLFVYAPTVGEGQIDGRYMDFTDPTTLARFQPSGIDNTEHSTNVTFYTPKVGNDDNKVQLGITYEPNMYDYGQNAIKYGTTGSNATGLQSVSPYQDVVKGAAQYTGNFNPVNVVASAQIINGYASSAAVSGTSLGEDAPAVAGNGERARDFTAWGVGTQVGYQGFTLGGSYTNMGRYMTVDGQNHNQEVWTLGGKYEMNKWAFAANWLNGQGYDNMLENAQAGYAPSTNNTNFVSGFNAYGVGAAYTWFPGLTSNIDGIMFTQGDRSVPSNQNDGYVLLVSQKMTF